MKKIFLILLVLAALTEGCKKYEDGPCISLRSVKNRLYGSHTLTKYTVDGVDSLSLYYDSLGLAFNFIYDDNSHNNVCIMDGPRKDGYSGDLYWDWELSNNRKILTITATGGYSYGTGPFGMNKTPEWEILRLKFNNIILKTSYNNKEYLIELERDK